MSTSKVLYLVVSFFLYMMMFKDVVLDYYHVHPLDEIFSSVPPPNLLVFLMVYILEYWTGATDAIQMHT